VEFESTEVVVDVKNVLCSLLVNLPLDMEIWWNLAHQTNKGMVVFVV
jgi:hypothetical protein